MSLKKVTLDDLKINEEYCFNRIADFVRTFLVKSKSKGYVVGLSGGVDSSTTLALLVRALGSSKVTALIMPETTSTPKEDIEDAITLAEDLGVKYHIIYIDDFLKCYRNLPFYDEHDRIAIGNLKARIRMTLLYYYANKFSALVCGTGDKSEILLGYFTKYGDGGVDLLPIGDLYKTQVRQLAVYLGVPEKIAYKPSSPRLWPGHLAEKELGLKYEEIDLILYTLFDLRMQVEEAIEATGISPEKFKAVLERVVKSEHKRKLPPIPRVSSRTVGLDWYYPIFYSKSASVLEA